MRCAKHFPAPESSVGICVTPENQTGSETKNNEEIIHASLPARHRRAGVFRGGLYLRLVGPRSPHCPAHPLSGPMALQGESVSRQLHAAADDINDQGGLFGSAKLEIVDFDDQLSPQQGLIALQSAISPDIRFVTRGWGRA
jgi:Periplasmic binding protein